MRNEFVISREDREYIRSSSYIDVDLYTSIKEGVFEKILNDDEYYNYVYQFFNTSQYRFALGVVEENRFIDRIILDKADVICGLGVYIKKKCIKDDTLLKKYLKLSETASIERLISKYQNEILEIDIDNRHYQINISDIIDFLMLDNYLFEMKCDDYCLFEIAGIPKKHFVYAIKKFVEKESIADCFVLPYNIRANIKDIDNNYLDIEAINQLVETIDTLHHDIEINEELHEMVYRGMPYDLSLLEKTLYIYIKLCKILSYNEEVEAFNQNEEVMLEHSDLSEIVTISPKNNQTVCYQFNIIFAKFLYELVVNFKTNYRHGNSEAYYGKSHVDLLFRVDEYLILADSVESMFKGDLAYAKINKHLSGIKCINKNEETQERFNTIFRNLYERMAMMEGEHVDEMEDFENLVNAYQKKTHNYSKIDINQKIHIIVDMINGRGLFGIDAIAYLIYLRKIFFSKDELNNNLLINIMAVANDYSKRKLGCIISYNKMGLKKGVSNYYLFIPGKNIIELSYDDVKRILEDEELVYIDCDSKTVPGFSKTIGKKSGIEN